ncbi:hypothetical protein J2X41_004590 [Caulobacter sp. BE254]|nr:hypothetical protein [Caulobacter sp. BE254]
MANIICGVDVSLKTLDGWISGSGLELSVPRSSEGIVKLARFCAEHGVELVVMEATGGYEKLPFGLLWSAGVPCAIANARSVRRFAEAMGVLEKTDRIDAKVIADYAWAKGLVTGARKPGPGTAAGPGDSMRVRVRDVGFLGPSRAGARGATPPLIAVSLAPLLNEFRGLRTITRAQGGGQWEVGPDMSGLDVITAIEATRP